MKSNISANDILNKTHVSYTPEEIIAAGGATAFGLKTQRKRDQALTAIENAPPIEPFTDEEWASLLVQLANDK